MSRNRTGLLNKFLSKTFHMIDQADPEIASWSADGVYFTIHNIEEFSKTILPKYFKHSKFTSFVRQLNFYSFRKLRNITETIETNAGTHTQTDNTQQQQSSPSNARKRRSTRSSGTTSVSFAHEFFQRHRPELLSKIKRTTRGSSSASSPSSSPPPSSSFPLFGQAAAASGPAPGPVTSLSSTGASTMVNPQASITTGTAAPEYSPESATSVQSMKNDISQMRHQLETFSRDMDRKLFDVVSTIDTDFQRRMHNLSISYQALAAMWMNHGQHRFDPAAIGATVTSAHATAPGVMPLHVSSSEQSSVVTAEPQAPIPQRQPEQAPATAPNRRTSPLVALSDLATAIITASDRSPFDDPHVATTRNAP
eukprot:CAMPEP_0198113012 /NCGR_PEP_ID=MMETSP1442-20131203/4774_1 /TAXON_ID= /ORGANISM="Craspedostauros australis, Strain CCMP3328" /LENGTH=365 /DNA_ID=CAMNT_0043769981 /DNA_START=592 /DNA_END=1689 /DNA_ORIENTATION=-